MGGRGRGGRGVFDHFCIQMILEDLFEKKLNAELLFQICFNDECDQMEPFKCLMATMTTVVRDIQCFLSY